MNETDKQENSPNSRGFKDRLKPLLGYLLAVVALIWVFRDVEFSKLLEYITEVKPGWVIAAIVADVATYACQGLRWRLLLRRLGSISVLRCTHAIYVGLFASEMLPLRVGEFVRAYLASRWLPADYPAVLPSIVVERLFDAFWLAGAVGVTAALVPLPHRLIRLAQLFQVFVLICGAIFVSFLIHRERLLKDRQVGNLIPWKRARPLVHFIEHLAYGLHSIGTSRYFYSALLASLGMLALQALSFWWIMLAYGLDLPFAVALVVFVIMKLGTAIPNAPANVGTFQFFVVLGLTFFGVDKTRATGFSLVVFVFLTLPLWTIGFFALLRCGTTLLSIREHVSRLMRQRQE